MLPLGAFVAVIHLFIFIIFLNILSLAYYIPIDVMAMCCKSNINLFLIFAVLALRVNDRRPYTPFKLLSFYRATRMHSADYAVARFLSVHRSVCPSHAGMVCKRLYISPNFFSPSGGPTIQLNFVNVSHVCVYVLFWSYM